MAATFEDLEKFEELVWNEDWFWFAATAILFQHLKTFFYENVKPCSV